MSSEILFGDQSSAAPAFWRTVASVPLDRAEKPAHDSIAETAQLVEQARRSAFEQGFAAGRKDAEQQFLPVADNLARTLKELAQTRESMRDQALQDLVRLATSIAARVIHREVVIDPDALAGLVKAAFSKMQSREISRVRMHPALEPLVRKCLEQAGSPARIWFCRRILH